VRLECKHFFSGAALYAEGTICVSLTPAGFAVKLPEESRAALLRERGGKPLRYFEGAPIKKGYVVLSAAVASNPAKIRTFLQESIRYVTRGKERRPTRQ
jgi:TfoX/Sxy family transcriptional regulator of competence genes